MRIYSNDIRMEFDIEQYAMLIMKSGKRESINGIELPNQNKINSLGEKENYKYLGILEADTIKYADITEQIQKRIPKENEKNNRN